MRVSQFVMIVPMLLQAVLGLAVAASYFHREWSGGAGKRLAGAYRAQFELPVLFYAGSLVAYAMRIVDERIIFFAMLFALAQVAGTAASLSGRDTPTAAASLVSVFSAAGLWTMIGLYFFKSGF